jgi:hypothetical protein
VFFHLCPAWRWGSSDSLSSPRGLTGAGAPIPKPDIYRLGLSCSTLAIQESTLGRSGKGGEAPSGNLVKSGGEVDITKLLSLLCRCNKALHVAAIFLRAGCGEDGQSRVLGNENLFTPRSTAPHRLPRSLHPEGGGDGAERSNCLGCQGGLVCSALETSCPCQGACCFSIAFRIVNRLRMPAVRATLAGFPTARQRAEKT